MQKDKKGHKNINLSTFMMPCLVMERDIQNIFKG